MAVSKDFFALDDVPFEVDARSENNFKEKLKKRENGIALTSNTKVSKYIRPVP